MNQNRKDRRKQIVPRPAWLETRKHRDAVEAAKKSRAREKASAVIQKHIRSHQRKPVVYIKGRDLNNPLAKVTTDRGWYYPKQTYARYEYLRDFLRNQPGDGGEGLYIEASPRWTTKQAKSFQKVYLPVGRGGGSAARVSSGLPPPAGPRPPARPASIGGQSF